jgi:hypothetical protein
MKVAIYIYIPKKFAYLNRSYNSAQKTEILNELSFQVAAP